MWIIKSACIQGFCQFRSIYTHFFCYLILFDTEITSGMNGSTISRPTRPIHCPKAYANEPASMRATKTLCTQYTCFG